VVLIQLVGRGQKGARGMAREGARAGGTGRMVGSFSYAKSDAGLRIGVPECWLGTF
jgi:hypothetical protein